MNVRRPECEEQPVRPMARYALANQATIAMGRIGPPRSDTMTGPFVSPVCSRNRISASRSARWIGMARPLPFLGHAFLQLGRGRDLAGWVTHHLPNQVSDFGG